MARAFLRTLNVFVIALTSFQAFAHEWVTERSWVEDPTGTMSLAQVQHAPQTPLNTKFFSQGYSKSAFWIRLHVVPDNSAQTQSEEHLIVRIRPPYLNQIEIYDPLSDKVRVSGILSPWSLDEYQSLNLNFVIPPSSESRDIWLRLVTNKSTHTAIDVLTERQAKKEDRRQEMLLMLYFSVLFICAGWGALSWWQNRDPLVRAYVIREAFTIAYGLMVLGYGRVYLSDGFPTYTPEYLLIAVGLLIPGVLLWFDYRLLSAFQANRWLTTSLKLLVTLMLTIGLASTVLYQPAIGMQAISILMMISMVLVILASFTTRSFDVSDAPDHKQPLFFKRFLVTVYLISLLSIIFHRFTLSGLVKGEDLSLYSQLFYPLFTAICFVVLLQIRANRLKQRQQLASDKLVRVEIEAEQQQRQHMEQTNFLRMLTHELKTPLSILRLITDSTLKDHKLGPRASEAVTNIDNIINRCIAVDKATIGQTSPSYSNVDVHALLFHCIQAAGIGSRVQFVPVSALNLRTDPEHLKTILLNLMDNPRKYAAENSPIEITSRAVTEGDTEVWCFSISNASGRYGQPDPDRVFEKYYRHESATRESGSGLGLFLVKTLIENLGGSVNYGAGEHHVTLYLTLPMSSPSAS